MEKEIAKAIESERERVMCELIDWARVSKKFGDDLEAKALWRFAIYLDKERAVRVFSEPTAIR